MQNYKQKVDEAADYLRQRIAHQPRIGLLTGTGLAQSAGGLDVSVVCDYQEIPHFPRSTIQSHPGKLLIGHMHDCPVVAMQGRFHLYEGYSPAEVTFPIRVMQTLGTQVLILTNAAGGLNPAFKAGDIMIIVDHINLTGANPLVGPNEDNWGIRFPDMTQAYDDTLIGIAKTAGESIGSKLHTGVYAGLKGPSLETPAEIRFLKTIGADAVGLSTVQEVIAAVHGNMRVMGFSTITNINDPDNPQPATLEEIIAVADGAAPVLDNIIRKVVEKINESELG